jgi:hypothetical protein
MIVFMDIGGYRNRRMQLLCNGNSWPSCSRRSLRLGGEMFYDQRASALILGE